MNFQTKIPLQVQQRNQIDYSSKILLIGSCFVENISKKLAYFKFQNTSNPFGILFHPLAIEGLITNAINVKEFSGEDVFLNNECWHSFSAHSKLSHPDKEKLIDVLNANVKSTNQQIKEATHIIITLGTSWVYRFIEEDTIVANCHKLPQKKFLKELLTIDEVTGSLQGIIKLLKHVNPQVSVIFTVSPVRHLKDGFVENMQSKAHLISATHQVINVRDKVSYFPSYEIIMDELRDYRFYTEDMIHPNTTAINYIWERFKHVWITKDAFQTMDSIDTVQKGLHHKPFNPETEQHKVFLASLKEKQQLLIKEFPHIIF